MDTTVQWYILSYFREKARLHLAQSVWGSGSPEKWNVSSRGTFDTERIIRRHLVLMGLWLRNDILVLFIELFCSAYKSAISQQIYFFELTEAPYSFAFYLLSLNKWKTFLRPHPFFFFNLFVYMHKVGLTSQKPKCQYFLKPWCETNDLVAQNTKFWSHGWNFPVTKSNACETNI